MPGAALIIRCSIGVIVAWERSDIRVIFQVRFYYALMLPAVVKNFLQRQYAPLAHNVARRSAATSARLRWIFGGPNGRRSSRLARTFRALQLGLCGIPEAVAASAKPADLPRCYRDDEGENDRCLITPVTNKNQTPTVRSSFYMRHICSLICNRAAAE